MHTPTIAMRSLLVGTLLFVAGSISASAAPLICLTAKNSEGQDVTGGFTQAPCEDTIEVVEFHQFAESDGTRFRLSKVIFTKLIDDATVDIYRAWGQGEVWAELAFSFYVNGQTGVLELSRTVKLENVQFADIELLDTDQVPDGASDPPRASERVRVLFDRITVIDEANTDQVTLQQ